MGTTATSAVATNKGLKPDEAIEPAAPTRNQTSATSTTNTMQPAAVANEATSTKTTNTTLPAAVVIEATSTQTQNWRHQTPKTDQLAWEAPCEP